MDIQTLQNSDVKFITDLNPPGWEGVTQAFNFYTNSAFCFPVKVTIDQKIIGIGSTIIHHETAWLAHIIVHPDFRNRSIGGMITQTLVESATAKHCETIYLLATELGEPVYKKIGFESETDYILFQGDKTNGLLKNSENIVAFNSDFKSKIFDLDRQVSGEDRSFHLEPHLPGSYVYLRENELKGIYLPSFGDGVILATTNDAGTELMKLRLSTKDFAAFPVDNINATKFMYQNNFVEVKRQKRMRLGVKRDWQPMKVFNRIGGNLG